MSTKIPVVDAREQAVHDRHCFTFDQDMYTWNGCKYGPDEECPTRNKFQHFRIHFEQVNQMWLDVDAKDRDHALFLAQVRVMDYVPTPDFIEMPNGEQLELDLT